MTTGYRLFADKIFFSYLPVTCRLSPVDDYYYLCMPIM